MNLNSIFNILNSKLQILIVLVFLLVMIGLPVFSATFTIKKSDNCDCTSADECYGGGCCGGQCCGITPFIIKKANGCACTSATQCYSGLCEGGECVGLTVQSLTAPDPASSKNYCDCYFENSTFKTDGRNGAPDFSWQYTDTENINLKSYQIRINNVNDVNDVNTEADLTVSDLNYASGTTIYQPIGVKISPSTNELAYNQTYYWWVKVCNQNDECSNWVAGSSFSAPARHFPIVRVVWDKAVLTTGETVQFCATADTSQPCASSTDPCCSVCWTGAGSPVVDPDNTDWKCSICYDSANNPVACQDVSSTYQWYMPAGFVENTDYNYVSATTNTSANPRVEFLTAGQDKKFRLYVSGSGCGGEGGGGIQLPVPEWKEITPF